MLADEINIRFIGGATALFQIGGLRFITDPAFDEKDMAYDTGNTVIHKLNNPLIDPRQLDKMDFVLLTNAHNYSSLDHTGREYLNYVEYVFTTGQAAAGLGANTVALNPWQQLELETKDGRTVVLVSIPCFQEAESESAESESGETDKPSHTGFLLYMRDDDGQGAVYITGNTIYSERLKDVASRFNVRLLLPFLGALKRDDHSTEPASLSAKEAVRLASIFDQALITPLQFEGWSHFKEGAAEIKTEFELAGLGPRLKWPYGFKVPH